MGMNIVTIEPTPSPNSMKIIVDEPLPEGISRNYRQEHADSAEYPINELLTIHGVKGIYHVMDFMAIERMPNVPWESILAEVRAVFHQEDTATKTETIESNDHFGEVYVHVQTYKGIPLQVKVFDHSSEQRFGLSDRFVKAMELVDKNEEENYILLRKWSDYGVRYGEKEEIGETVVKEIEAAYPQERLDALMLNGTEGKASVPTHKKKISIAEFQKADWEKRFQLLDEMPDPDVGDLPLLALALEDEKMSIRRLATVYLGMIEDEAVIPYIEKALKDKSWAVRRTAGDCMSDLGFERFESAAVEALTDKNKLVRWRAAMFLYETGTENALPALRQVEDDPEFEVKLQIRMAIARIEEGEEAKGSVWKQMTEARMKE